MPLHPRGALTRRARSAGGVCAAVLLVASAGAAAAGRTGTSHAPAAARTAPALPAFDVRHAAAGSPSGLASAAGAADGAQRRAVAALKRSLGPQGVVAIDPVTGTPRMIARADGLLTPPEQDDAADLALGYVRAHLDVFGLQAADLGNFRLTRRWTGIDGVTHLTWAQVVGGIPAYDNFLRANVTADGRLVDIVGAPLADLSTPTDAPRLSAADALHAAQRDVGADVTTPAAKSRANAARTTTFGAAQQASLVRFGERDHTRLAWQVVVRESSTAIYDEVVDAAGGEVLARHNLVQYAATGLTHWNYFPGAPVVGQPYDPGNVDPRSGAQHTDVLSFPGMSTTALDDNNVHVYSDVNDDDRAGTAEEIAPTSGAGTAAAAWNWPFAPVSAAQDPNGFCDVINDQCSWIGDFSSPAYGGSWKLNRKANGDQVFFFLNNFHDHLLAAPIGFTEAAGNFQKVNPSGQGAGGDAVQAEADDGADTGARHGPDDDHVLNANMFTPTDGSAPRMQMYLFATPDGQTPFADTNGGDDAAVVYHEYTHGLSNRLVTDASGAGALNTWQSAAMGEAWSDWYAMDYIVADGMDADTAAPGDVIVGYYSDGAGQAGLRSQGLDCQPGDPAGPRGSQCPGGSTPHAGGYTYADYGAVAGGPEVHADGEIWGETLWDIRRALGSQVAEQLVTQGMELSPPNPSFLDMRNAIVLADAMGGGAHQATLWQVFARRGMGYFATTRGANDTHPRADFHTPAGGEMPMSSFTATPGEPMTGQAVRFDGSASHAPDGAIVSATWSFGDGASATGLKARHRFAQPGHYAVSLTVRNHAGLTSTSTATVNVRDRAPVVRLSWHPRWARRGHSIRFKATAHDSDGRVVSYRFNFGGGQVRTGRVARHTFRSPGRYRVRVTVTDDRGRATTVRRWIRVH